VGVSELVKGLPCRQRLSLYYWEYLSSDGRLGANFGDEVMRRRQSVQSVGMCEGGGCVASRS